MSTVPLFSCFVALRYSGPCLFTPFFQKPFLGGSVTMGCLAEWSVAFISELVFIFGLVFLFCWSIVVPVSRLTNAYEHEHQEK